MVGISELLQRILTVHPDFFSIESETGLFSSQEIFSRRHFDLDQQHSDALISASSNIVDFMDRAITVLQKDRPECRFVEKTPQHVRRLRFLIKHFPNAQFVHIHPTSKRTQTSWGEMSEQPETSLQDSGNRSTHHPLGVGGRSFPRRNPITSQELRAMRWCRLDMR